jgi:hypothetical protein
MPFDRQNQPGRKTKAVRVAEKYARAKNRKQAVKDGRPVAPEDALQRAARVAVGASSMPRAVAVPPALQHGRQPPLSSLMLRGAVQSFGFDPLTIGQWAWDRKASADAQTAIVRYAD